MLDAVIGRSNGNGKAATQTGLPLVSRQLDVRTAVWVGDVPIGGERAVVIAGPCSVESREQVLDTAFAVRDSGAVILRGGAYKPRTSPYDFQGLGIETHAPPWAHFLIRS